jgi:hypothetical protein
MKAALMILYTVRGPGSIVQKRRPEAEMFGARLVRVRVSIVLSQIWALGGRSPTNACKTKGNKSATLNNIEIRGCN